MSVGTGSTPGGCGFVSLPVILTAMGAEKNLRKMREGGEGILRVKLLDIVLFIPPKILFDELENFVIFKRIFWKLLEMFLSSNYITLSNKVH
jgi:hypothetical protein